MKQETRMHWPNTLSPDHCYMYAYNDIVIPAPPEQVWKWLVQVAQWPEWYPNCAWTRPPAPELALGTTFTWKTFGVVVRSHVTVFEPSHRIEWNAEGRGISAYHGWLIEYDGQQSHVITEEAQGGFLAWLSRFLFPHRLWRGHQLWVERLKNVVMMEQK